MKYYIFFLLSIFISINSFNLRSTKQNYDSYVMSVIWVNGYCAINNCSSEVISKLEPNIFTIHGLWPSLKSGKMLEDCTTGVKIVEKTTRLYSDLKLSWPSFHGDYIDFWEHEYNKHGYCMSEENNWDNYENYFRIVNNLYLRKFKLLMLYAFNFDTSKKMITITQEEMNYRLQKVMTNANFKMLCTNGIIHELYFYLNKDYTPSTNSVFSSECKIGKLLFK